MQDLVEEEEVLPLPDTLDDPYAYTPRIKLTHNNRGLTQAYEIRDFAARTIQELKAIPATTLEDQAVRAGALRSATYVWQEASERIRILLNKPMPGSLRPVAKVKATKKPSSVPTEEP